MTADEQGVARVSLGTAVLCLDILQDVRARLLVPLLDDRVSHEGKSADELRAWLAMLSGVAGALAEQISFAMDVQETILDIEETDTL